MAARLVPFHPARTRSDPSQPTGHGSVNAPHHHNSVYSVQTITELFERHGLVDVHAEIRGELLVFGPENPVPNLVARGRKPA